MAEKVVKTHVEIGIIMSSHPMPQQQRHSLVVSTPLGVVVAIVAIESHERFLEPWGCCFCSRKSVFQEEKNRNEKALPKECVYLLSPAFSVEEQQFFSPMFVFKDEDERETTPFQQHAATPKCTTWIVFFLFLKKGLP